MSSSERFSLLACYSLASLGIPALIENIAAYLSNAFQAPTGICKFVNEWTELLGQFQGLCFNVLQRRKDFASSDALQAQDQRHGRAYERTHERRDN